MREVNTSGRQILRASLLLAAGVLAAAAIMKGTEDVVWSRGAGAALMAACLAGGMLMIGESPYSRGTRLAAAAILIAGYLLPAALGAAVTDMGVISSAGGGIVLMSVAATPTSGPRWCRSRSAFLGGAALIGVSLTVASLF